MCYPVHVDLYDHHLLFYSWCGRADRVMAMIAEKKDELGIEDDPFAKSPEDEKENEEDDDEKAGDEHDDDDEDINISSLSLAKRKSIFRKWIRMRNEAGVGIVLAAVVSNSLEV